MANERKRHSVCYLCGNTDFDIVHKGVRGNESIDVYRCKTCGLVFLSDFFGDTDGFYMTSGMRRNDSDRDDVIRIRKNAYDDDLRRFNFIEKCISNKRILDFGCGGGGFLHLAKESAKSICGIELEKKMVDYLGSEGIRCYNTVDEAEYAMGEEKVDVITLWHVLEHMDDPIAILKRLSNLLSEDGRIFIEVPNSEDALLSIFQNQSFADFTYWECHYYLYNNYTLRRVIEKADFSVDYIKQIQRYPLANHLYWLSNGKPGGHEKWTMMLDEQLDKEYGCILSSLGCADTIIAECHV